MEYNEELYTKLFTVRDSIRALNCGAFSAMRIEDVIGDANDIESKFWRLWDWMVTNYATSSAILASSSILMDDIITLIDKEHLTNEIPFKDTENKA